MHLRRGKTVKTNIPEKNIISGIRRGKLVASDEVSFDGKIWEALGDHPSFCAFFEKAQPTFARKPKKSEAIQKENVAGFFRRLFAFSVDFLIVYLLFGEAGKGVFNIGVSFHNVNSFVLFSIAILYFSLFESGLAKGKTIGKLAMSLKVVDGNGDSLSFGASLLRASFFFITMSLFFATPDIKHLAEKYAVVPEPYIAAVCFIIFSGLYIGNLLYIAFHPQKRGFHDIIASGYLVYRQSGKTALHNFSAASVIAACVGSIVFAVGGVILLQDSIYFYNPYSAANVAKEVEEDRKYHIDRIQTADGPGWTSLHRAAAKGDLNEVIRLVDSGANVDVREGMEATALYEAARRGQLDIMNYLLDKGADIDSRQIVDFTPLHIAAEYHQADSMRLLIKRGADVNAMNVIGMTPLRQAAAQTWHEDGLMAEILVDAGADMTIRSTDGCIPVYCAITSNNVPFVAYLLKKGADPDTERKGWSILIHAVSTGNLSMVKTILEYKPNINFRLPETGVTSLLMAIKDENFEIANLLLKHDPNLNIRDKKGTTALRWARINGNFNLMHELMKRGAKF